MTSPSAPCLNVGWQQHFPCAFVLRWSVSVFPFGAFIWRPRYFIMALLRYLFSLLFLFRIRTSRQNNFHDLVRQRYSSDVLTSCRSLEKTAKRLRKAELDLDFLLYCKMNHITPNFVKFKLYKCHTITLKQL